MFLKLVIITSLIFAPVIGFADSSGLYIWEGLLGYSISFTNSPTSVQQRNFFSSETGLGYIIGGWAYIGGVFNYTPVTEKTADGNGNTINHTETYQYYGPTFGYMGDNWFVLGHYFANAEKKDTITGGNGFVTQNVDNTGTGFGINVGYKFSVGSSFEMAPMIAFKSINYVNCKDPYSGATSTCNPSIQQTEFTPYFTFLFNFK